MSKFSANETETKWEKKILRETFKMSPLANSIKIPPFGREKLLGDKSKARLYIKTYKHTHTYIQIHSQCQWKWWG